MKKFECLILIDDDDDCCFLVKCYQERLGLAKHFYTYHDVLEALQHIKNSFTDGTSICPDLILLDINMPVMDGFEFLEELDALCSEKTKPKVFILTSSDDIRDKKQASKFEVDGYFVKPVTQKNLDYLIAS
jgi:CheY-like chemotaxis protein